MDGEGPGELLLSPDSDLSTSILDPNVGAVVMGFDFGIDFWKMMMATSYARHEQNIFLATNPDESCRVGELTLPGTPWIVLT